jgi:hypothetical protein
MEYARHEARMNAPVPGSKDSTPYRDHLKVAARSSARAREELQGPEFPESVGYLLGWTREVHCRSGLGQIGFLPVTWATIDAWARRTRTDPRPHEIDAMFVLDAVMLHLEPEKASDG